MTCLTYGEYSYVKDFVNKALEAIQNLIQTFQRVFRSLCDKISDSFKRFRITIEECLEPKPKSYPHSFPRYVDKVQFHKLNKRGYPRPIMRCARSRC